MHFMHRHRFQFWPLVGLRASAKSVQHTDGTRYTGQVGGTTISNNRIIHILNTHPPL